MDNNSFKDGNERESHVPGLSVLADYDEVCRSINSLIDCEHFSAMIKSMTKCEESLFNRNSTRNLNEMETQSEDVEDSNRPMKDDIKSISECSGDNDRQQDLNQEIKGLTANLKIIRDFVTTELLVTSNKMDERSDQIISLVNDLHTIREDSEESMDSEIEFNKTEEIN